MSPPRRIRTKSTNGNPPRHLRKKNQLKRQVAAEAARIIATEGQHNYHAAKRKAAARIGVSDRLALPANLEVQEALSAYLQLYGGESHQQNLYRMRSAAIEAMRSFDSWNARLVGAVLDGTAVSHARITLHVFCDSPDDLVHHLMENNIPFRQEQRQIRWHDGNQRILPILVIKPGEHTVELMVFNELQLRQSPPCPIDGKPQKRATLAEVEKLLASSKPRAA